MTFSGAALSAERSFGINRLFNGPASRGATSYLTMALILVNS